MTLSGILNALLEPKGQTIDSYPPPPASLSSESSDEDEPKHKNMEKLTY